jgi:hypothetical protein
VGEVCVCWSLERQRGPSPVKPEGDVTTVGDAAWVLGAEPGGSDGSDGAGAGIQGLPRLAGGQIRRLRLRPGSRDCAAANFLRMSILNEWNRRAADYIRKR